MRIGILGSGSIGLLFASALRRAGADPLCLVRRQELAKTLETGLSVRTAGETSAVRLSATMQRGDILHCDLVLLCVRAWQAEQAARELLDTAERELPEGSAEQPKLPLFLSLMNGLESELPFVRLFSASSTLAGLTYAGARLDPVQGLLVAGTGPTLLPASAAKQNATSAQATRLAELAAHLERSGFECRSSTSLDTERWIKVAVNSAINPLASLHRLRNGELLSHHGLLAEVRAVLSEAALAAATAGHQLEPGMLYERFTATCRRTATNICSMRVDLEAGRPTELYWLNAAILRQAEEFGLELPVNRRLVEQVRQLEARATHGE